MSNDARPGSYFDYYGKSPGGVEMALHIDIPEPLPVAGQAAEEYATALAIYLRKIDVAMAAMGFTRSDRLDKPQYGGGRPGNKRPEDPAPADIPVPEHCGEKMVYKPSYTNKDGKLVTARFVCRKEKQCEDVTGGASQYPHAVWEDAYRRQLGATKPAEDGMTSAVGTGRNQPKPASPAKASQLSAFWAEVRGELRFTPEEAATAAGAAIVSLTADQLTALLQKLRAKRQVPA